MSNANWKTAIYFLTGLLLEVYEHMGSVKFA